MAAKSNQLLPLAKVEAEFRTENHGRWDRWEVLEFRVSESIDDPYSGTIDIASRDRSVDFSQLLGKSCALEIRRGERRRLFKGMVFRIEILGTNPVASVARIGFAAALWALHHGTDSRIFENRTAPQIIEEVLTEGLSPFGRKARVLVSREYASREYSVQYQESDLAFVQRLMADEGMALYFDQGEEGDRETVVLVDSNEAFPEIDTMGSKEVEETEPQKRSLMDFATIGQSWTDAKPASTWVEVKVVWDDTGEPVANLPVVVEPLGGRWSMLTTRLDGLIRLEPVDQGSCEARCTFRGLTRDECVAYVGMGEGDGTTRPAADQGQEAAPRARPKAIARVETRKVRSGETLESIAREAGLTWQELAFFNWETNVPHEVNEHLAAEVGCTKKTADRENYVFDDSDRPGTLLIPTQWRMPRLATGREHVIRVRAIDRTRGVLELHTGFLAEEAASAGATFILTGAGGREGAVELTRTAKDDSTPEDQLVSLRFAGVPVDAKYTLRVRLTDGSDIELFKDVSFQELHGQSKSLLESSAEQS